MKGEINYMKLKSSNLLWGLIFIAAGILYIGDSIFSWNIVSFSLIFQLWPLFILLPSITGLVTKGINISSITGCFIGTILLLFTLNVLEWYQVRGLIIPGILIIIGLNIIFKDVWIRKMVPKEPSRDYTSKEPSEYSAIFSSQKINYPNDVFTGTSINSIFGGVELDLRNAIITEDVVINCTCIFAGADIYVPYNVNVKVSSVPIFGGVSNKSADRNNQNAPTIYVNATCMFGGLDIK